MEYTVINYLFDKDETVSEGICFTSHSKVTGLFTIVLQRCRTLLILSRVFQEGE